VDEDGVNIGTCRFSEQPHRNLTPGATAASNSAAAIGAGEPPAIAGSRCAQCGRRAAPTSAVSFTTFTKRSGRQLMLAIVWPGQGHFLFVAGQDSNLRPLGNELTRRNLPRRDKSHTSKSGSFQPSRLFRDVSVVRLHFSLFCSQIRSQHSNQAGAVALDVAP
jgi:hypothetical protein